MSSSLTAPVHKIPRSEYIPATLKQTRDKVNKGKTNSSEDVKHSNLNKSPRTSRIPKQTAQNPRVQRDSPDTKNVKKSARSPVDNKKTIGIDQKQKTSHIPRRRNDNKEPILKDSGVGDTEIAIHLKLPTEHPNVQRVQLLNVDTDFYTEHQSEAISKAKPIPTYAQIYRHNYITDWGLQSVSELIANNSLYSIPRIMEITEDNNDLCAPQHHIIIDSTQNREYESNRSDRSTLSNNDPRGAFKTTNENVSDWLASEFEQSTRDNESGYRSMSPPSKITSNIKQRENLRLRTVENETEIVKKSHSSAVICEDKGNLLTERETVVVTKIGPESRTPQNVYQAIPKINTDFKNIPINTDLRKNIKFPSTPNPVRHRENPNSIPIPSYVECPSEVIQKTTNFEGIDVLSSVADTEVETCEDMSQCTLEQTEEESVDRDRVRNEWSRQESSSQASTTLLNMSKTSDEITNSTWYSRFNYHRDGLHDDSERKWSDNRKYHDYHHHYCWRKEVNRKFDNLNLKEHKGRRMKCHKCKRKSKNKRRLSQPFEILRRRISIGRICRPRWKGVWKRTAERWWNWTKAPNKFRKARAIHCLHSIYWDNANVQTTIFVYREMGTDAVAKEQKSAEITASLKLRSWSAIHNKVKAGQSGMSFKSNKSHVNHPNVGPSMFPFLTGTNSSIIKKCINRKKYCNTSQDNVNVFNLKEPIERKDATTDTEPQWLHKSTSFIAIVNDTTEMGTDTPSRVENKTTSIMLGPNAARTSLVDTGAPDVFQKPMTFNYTETDTPSMFENLLTSVVLCANPARTSLLEAVTQNVLTQMAARRNDAQTQVTPAESTRAISAGVSTSHQICQRSKPSVVTDTTLPCRKIGAKEFSTSLTPKGTILSCTGTKITSVSSRSIDAMTVIPTQSAVVSAEVTVNNVDCLTAKSLHERGHRDISLDTRIANEVLYNNKSSCTSGLGQYTLLSTGVSAFDVVEQKSFGGGSHHTKRSVVTEFHPEHNSAITNTITEVKSKSAGRTCSVDSLLRSSDSDRVDAFVQYSGYGNNDHSKYAHQSACIGRSQLMSMRMLCDSATEAAIQAQPMSISAETKTTPRNHMSTSVFTSQYFLGEPVSTSMVAHREIETVNPAPILVCGCAQVGSTTDPSQGNVPSDKTFTVTSKCNVINVASIPTKDYTKPLQVGATESKSCTASNNYEPNTVISSNLNAAKWMKGYPNNVEKDFQSIVNISRSAVSESLEHASLVIENSRALILEATKRLAQEKTSIKEPVTSNCMTALAAKSNESLLDVLPTKDLTKPMDETECKKMVDKITSDKVVTKEWKETVIQASPSVRESGLDCMPLPVIETKSASVLTSRFILPDPLPCVRKNFGSLQTECLFLYDQPRCIIHKHREDAGIQQECYRQCDIAAVKVEANCSKQEAMTSDAGGQHTSDFTGDTLLPQVTQNVNRCSAAVLTSQTLTFPPNFQQHANSVVEDVTPVKQAPGRSAGMLTSASGATLRSGQQQTSDLIGEVVTQQEIAEVKHEVTNPTTVMSESFKVPSQAPELCPRHTTDTIKELLTPRAYKALYETTKSLIKENSKPPSPAHASARASVCGKGSIMMQAPGRSAGMLTSNSGATLRSGQQQTSELIRKVVTQQVKQVPGRSAGMLTSASGATLRSGQQQTSDLIGEVATQQEIAEVKHEVTNPTTVMSESFKVPSQAPELCPRHTTDTIKEVLTPRAYKALYETTKSLIKENSKPPSPARASARASVCGKGSIKTQNVNRCSAAVLTSHTFSFPPNFQQHANSVVEDVTPVKQAPSRSAGMLTSASGATLRSGQQQTSDLIGEVATQQEIAEEKHEVTNPTTVMSENFKVPSQAPELCPRHTTDTIKEVLTPRAYKALYETTKSLIKENSKPPSPARASARASVCGKGSIREVITTNKSLQARLHCCCKLYNQTKDKESCTRSTQAVLQVANHCPHCCVEPLDEPQDQELGTDSVEEYLTSYLMSSCRYYTNILTKHLDRVKENLKNYLTIPGDGGNKASSVSTFFIEACTMKPSGRQNHCCQTDIIPDKLKNLNKLLTLTTALSATDFRDSQDKQDLKAMYHILSSIEGRVHRLKSHLLT